MTLKTFYDLLNDILRSSHIIFGIEYVCLRHQYFHAKAMSGYHLLRNGLRTFVLRDWVCKAM